MNNILAQHISRRYAHVKFAKVLATDIDFGSEASGGGGGGDTVALPALLCYKGGQLVHTLLRIADEIPGFAASGRCEADDFEEFLVRRRILNDDLICD